MKPSVALKTKRNEIRELVGRFTVVNPRVFGSAARETDTEESDLDILVDALPETTLFDLGGLQNELEEMLGVRVQVLTPGDIPKKFRRQVIDEALPV